MTEISEFESLSKIFEERFDKQHFPDAPKGLYEASEYPFSTGGKRIRPVMCLMARQLFENIDENTWHAANAIELFHNFTLVHDDIMDNADIRRGRPSVHKKFGANVGILSGDTILIYAYMSLSKIDKKFQGNALRLFNDAARLVCEGQYLDMDFETRSDVSMDEYIDMISKKTSVLIAASLKMGAMLGNASVGNQNDLYEFGRNLGIAFQIQDDYLDAFGDAEKFGKKIGGDIMANKKTFLSIHALNTASTQQKEELKRLSELKTTDRIKGVIEMYKQLGSEEKAHQMKEEFYNKAMLHLEEVALREKRKEPLHHLAKYLMEREK